MENEQQQVPGPRAETAVPAAPRLWIVAETTWQIVGVYDDREYANARGNKPGLFVLGPFDLNRERWATLPVQAELGSLSRRDLARR